MNSRETIKAILNHKPTERIGFQDAYWPETIDRWHQEGLPLDIKITDTPDYFNLDIIYIVTDFSFQLPEEILEETDEYMIKIDSKGMKAKWWKARMGTPQLLDFLIKGGDDWQRYKPCLIANKERLSLSSFEEAFFNPIQKFPSLQDWDSALEGLKRLKEKGKFIALAMENPYEATWPKCGVERLLMNMVEQPDLVEDMFTTHTELVLDTCRLMLNKGFKPDGVFLAGDMGYKNGLLFSPQAYRRLLSPCHRKLAQFFNENDMPVIFHSDGDFREVIPDLIEEGMSALQPLEAKAGIDVRELKKRYDNQIVFMGNIDVTKMSGTRKEIEEELRSKIMVAKQGGGYIYHSDHTVPPSVSFDNYNYVVELVRKYGKY